MSREPGNPWKGDESFLGTLASGLFLAVLLWGGSVIFRREPEPWRMLGFFIVFFEVVLILGYFTQGPGLTNFRWLPERPESLVETLERAAEQGNIEAQVKIGLAYYNGSGVPQNYRAAFRWFSRAAKAGHPEAQYRLGEILYFGQGGIPADEERAFELYRLAANQGHSRAQGIHQSRKS